MDTAGVSWESCRMKFGLLTDIHEASDFLQRALNIIAREQVDQIVFLGDLISTGHNAEATCRLLSQAEVLGVWGNHDYGLCRDVPDELRTKFHDSVFQYTEALQPRLVIEDCHFSHVEPWLNPERIEDLWFFEGPPDDHGRLERIFNAVPQQFMFAGHSHRWLVVSPEGIHDWTGTEPIRLNQGRYFVVVGALCQGAFATFDTENGLLTPYQLE